MHHAKRNYHPLFIILFVLDLLPYEAVQQVPRTTRNEWSKRNLNNTFGSDCCALYIKHFDNVAYAHKYTFTRNTLAIAIDIQKTLLDITQTSQLYKKLLRFHAANIISHITSLALKGFSVSKASRLFGIKSSWYHYHKRKINCPLNVLKTCFRRHPNQLSDAEQQNIKQWITLEQNTGKNLIQLFYGALNKAIVFCSKNTFSFYAKSFGYKKASRIPKAKQKKGYRADKAFECLHVDTTYIPTVLDGVLKMTMVKDNYSKAPLHFAITENNVSSFFVKQLLAETFDKYQLFNRTHDIHIISDGGPENKGAVTTWVNNMKAPPRVHKIIAKSTAFPHANNMIEGSFHLFKHDFLKGETITDKKQLFKKAEAFIDHCQNRHFGELYGLTPLQVLNGEIPDKKRFAVQIQQAMTDRRKANKGFNNCNTTNFCEL